MREALRHVLDTNVVDALGMADAFLGLLGKPSHIPPW